jgi:hypothetical protein
MNRLYLPLVPVRICASLRVFRLRTQALRRPLNAAAALKAGIALLLFAACNGVGAASCVPVTGSDWMVSSDPLAARIRPADCATVEQSPPDFGWPDLSNDASYQVTVTYPGGATKTLSAPQNWLNWNEVLPAGTYSWRVQVTSSGGTKTSQPRHFIVPANASPFLVPATATLLNRVTSKARPRGLPDASTLSTMAGQRQSAIAALVSEVNGKIGNSLPNEPTSSVDDAVHTECKQTLKSLMAYVYTRQDSHYNDALRRVMNLASWDPRGPTAYAKVDMASRFLAWTVTLGYDWLSPRMTSTQKNKLLDMLRIRAGDMYNDIIGSRPRIAQHPRDSHANQTLTVLAAISVLLAGDLSEANTWLNKSLPLALNATNPWGGEEGGFGNADTQGTWDVGEALVPWYTMRWAIGVDLAQKGWVRAWARFIAYFIPPGTPTGVFGDGAEYALTENWARFGKGYSNFSPTPLGRWYASKLNGEDATRIEYLLSPPSGSTNGAFPAGTPNTAVFPTIGQVAMHSDLSSNARTSIYFKSSPPPYGAYNHSHADQNSFVVNAGGQRLAINSGYYDDYKTPHWWQWYHTTRSKNAITYDGGKGQLFYEQDGKMGYGAITGYRSGAGYEIVTGDASKAYGNALTRAKRSLVYLRPNMILVYDTLASGTPRQWEWNIHAVNAMKEISERKIQITSGNQSLCIDMLAGPAMRFTQTDRFTANPSSGARQWHGNFYSVEKLGATEFIALMRVGCPATTASAVNANGVWTVLVNGKTVTIGGGGITVGGDSGGSTPPPSPTPTPTTGQRPFGGTPKSVPGIIQAEKFDLGGEGVAYHDKVRGNAGGQFRPNEDVDIISSSDSKGGRYVVNNFQTGEWLEYTINVQETGRYDFLIRASSNNTASAFHINVDGVNVTGKVIVPYTGDWTAFRWVLAKRGVRLTAGTHVVRIKSEWQYFNLNSLHIRTAK